MSRHGIAVFLAALVAFAVGCNRSTTPIGGKNQRRRKGLPLTPHQASRLPSHSTLRRAGNPLRKTRTAGSATRTFRTCR